MLVWFRLVCSVVNWVVICFILIISVGVLKLFVVMKVLRWLGLKIGVVGIVLVNIVVIGYFFKRFGFEIGFD